MCTCLRGRSVETARTGPHASPELMLDTMDRLDGGARSFPSQTAADRTPSRRARCCDPAAGRCLPSWSNFRTGEEMPVPHTPHASTETKKVGAQIFLLTPTPTTLLMVRR